MRDNEKKRQYLTRVSEKINHKQMKSEVAFELDSHIDERAQFYEEIGYSEEEAFEKAVEQMGDPERVGVSLSRLHPTTDNKLFTICSLILVGFLMIAFRFSVLLNSDGKLSLLYEVPLLLCFLGLSYFAQKRKSVLLCRLLPLLYFCIYGWYLFYILYDYGDKFDLVICSPFVFALSCVLTGDFVCLGTFWRVGGVTVAPWLSYTSIVFYILIFLLLVSAAVSVKKLEQPPYSLFDKRAGKVLTATEKYICIALVLLVPISWLPFRAASRQLGLSHSAKFDYVVILQSDSPCALADVPLEDVWIAESNYDLTGRYLFSWWWTLGNYNDMSYRDDVTVVCGKKMQYKVRKEIIGITATKPYVSIYFIKHSTLFDKVLVYETLYEFLPQNLEWQSVENVEPISRVYDAYNCVEVTIHTGE